MAHTFATAADIAKLILVNKRRVKKTLCPMPRSTTRPPPTYKPSVAWPLPNP